MSIIDHRPSCTRKTSRHLPPVQCRPWCERGNGHPREWHPEDQACMSAHPPVDTGDTEIGAHLTHRPRLGVTTITLYSQRYAGPDGLVGSEELTVAEARALAAALTDCCDTVEAEQTGGAR